MSDRLTPECLSRLNQAIALYSDDFLAGFNLPDCPAFDEWQFFERESLRKSLAQVLTYMVQLYQTQALFNQAIDYARRLLALDPMHEPAHYQLMQLYWLDGQKAAALRQFQECSRILNAELGLAPQPATVELFEAIKAGQDVVLFTERPAYPPVRYVKSGEVHITYQVLGNEPVDIVFASGFVSHLEQMWDEPVLAGFLRRLASFSRLILFDKRGVGLSDRIGYASSMEQTMDDVLAILDAVGANRIILFGVSEGGPNSVLFAATYPERVAALILYGTMAKFTRDIGYPSALTREQWDKWLNVMLSNWGEPLNIEQFAPSRSGEPQFRMWWTRSLRSASSPGAIRAILEVAADIDVRHILPAIHVPTLILHRVGDRLMRIDAARYMAQQIPNAKYVELPGIDHWWWVGDTDTLWAEIETFVEGYHQPVLSNRILVTLMQVEFSEPDDSQMAQWSQNVANYFALARGEIAHFRGRLVRQAPTNFLSTFDGPSRSLQCARSLQQAAQRMGITIRAGLHTGECEFTGSNLEGQAVKMVYEVMSNAPPSIVLMSSTVKDLVAGSGFQVKSYIGTNRNTLGELSLYELSSL